MFTHSKWLWNFKISKKVDFFGYFLRVTAIYSTIWPWNVWYTLRGMYFNNVTPIIYEECRYKNVPRFIIVQWWSNLNNFNLARMTLINKRILRNQIFAILLEYITYLKYILLNIYQTFHGQIIEKIAVTLRK